METVGLVIAIVALIGVIYLLFFKKGNASSFPYDDRDLKREIEILKRGLENHTKLISQLEKRVKELEQAPDPFAGITFSKLIISEIADNSQKVFIDEEPENVWARNVKVSTQIAVRK